MIKLIENFFSSTECDDTLAEVYQNQSLWYQCSETDMYILGNSLLRNQSGNYLDNNIYNFNSVTLFKEKLSSLFPKVEFVKHLGKPGFQIIKQNGTSKPCVWHYDSILLCFPYEKEFSDFTNFHDYFDEYYIFTLMMTDGKSSFDFYPETKSNFPRRDIEETEKPLCKEHEDLLGDVCVNPNCQLKEFQTIYYTPGSLIVQTERVLHRIGSRDINGTDASRISLQGYGVVKNGTMYLCW